MSRAERASRSGEGEQEDRLQATLQTLEAGIDSILSSDGFAAYLKTMAKLPHYSFGNVLLIHAQHPAPTMVAGYRRWQSLGRQVRKGERGIKILVPYTRKIAQDDDSDETLGNRMAVRGFGVGTVFDVSSTDGDPLPEPPHPEVIGGASDIGMRLYADLLDYLELHGVTATREETKPSNGYYQPFTRHVGIGHHIDGDQATKTLTHEVAHMVSGHLSGIERRDAETIAESAAFVVLTHYGIDSSDYTFPYVATWAQDRAVLKRNLAAIQQVSHRIIAGLEGDESIEPLPAQPAPITVFSA